MIDSLYECFKKWSKTGSVWIISDPHFGDSDCEVMDPGWITPEEHLKILNKAIKKTDTLVCLGDVGDENFIRRINAGYKVLITGNHDKGSSAYEKKTWDISLDHIEHDSDDEDRMRDYDERVKKEIAEIAKDDRVHVIGKGYSFNAPYTYVRVDNKLFDEIYTGPLFIADRILLSHEPITGLEDICVNIHGHVHCGVHRYEGHVNLASDVVNFQPFNLGKEIRNGLLSGVKNYHRITVELATKNGGHKHK